MTVKGNIASKHLARLREIHGQKSVRLQQNVFMTGDLKRGSIGERIRLTLRDQQHRVTSFIGDIQDTSQWFQYQNELENTDTLILCHGVTSLAWFEDLSLSKIREIFDVNLVATTAMTQFFVQSTLFQPWRKRIIIIGSMAHRVVLNGSSAYCASKAGLAMLGRCLAWELAPKAYDVFVVHPSNTLGTPMTEDTIQGLMRYQHLDRQTAEAYWNDSPIRDTILTTHDIAKLIQFLISPDSSYLSGAQLELAGGQR